MRRGYAISVIVSTVVAIAGLGGVLLAHWAPVLGLDLRGGISVVYKPEILGHPHQKVSSSDVNEAINIINNRVNALGVAQPNIGSQGGDIVVQLPGVKDQKKALQIVGATAQLMFRPVLCLAPA